MNLFDTHNTNMRLVDILQLIPPGEKVRVRLIHHIEEPTVVIDTPRQISRKKEEWLRYEILCVTREFSKVGLMQIDIMNL